MCKIQSKTVLLYFMAAFCGLFSSCTGSGKREIQPDDALKNQTVETIMNRKSVREYSNKEISAEDMRILLTAGMSAPSSRDRRPWHFIAISDQAVLDSLGNRLKTAAILKNANKAIAVCGDVTLSDNCWFLDCSAATQNILLAAESMGIGAVWTAVYPYEDRALIAERFLQLPENVKILSIIPLGYPLKDNSPKDKFDESRLHYNRW